MRFKIEERELITRRYVQGNRHKIFLFGDNLLERGFGGQAKAMRGEPNAFGIPTKKKPSMQSDAFFIDDEFEENKEAIDRAFQRILLYPVGTIVVIPTAGLGTGKAEMQSRAARTLSYLNSKLQELQSLP